MGKVLSTKQLAPVRLYPAGLSCDQIAAQAEVVEFDTSGTLAARSGCSHITPKGGSSPLAKDDTLRGPEGHQVNQLTSRHENGICPRALCYWPSLWQSSGQTTWQTAGQSSWQTRGRRRAVLGGAG